MCGFTTQEDLDAEEALRDERERERDERGKGQGKASASGSRAKGFSPKN